MEIQRLGCILLEIFKPRHTFIYVQYHLSWSEGKGIENIEAPADSEQVASMGHFIFVILLNPAVCLEVLYPYANDQAELDASIPKLITAFL
jgi:hypothetical protein